MRKFLSVIICLFSLSAYGGLRISVIPYNIVSDEFDSTIPKGHFVVVGNATDNQGVVCANALVSTTDFERQTTTDSLGNFRLPLLIGDTSIFLFQFGHSEIVVYHDFKDQHLVKIQFTPEMNYSQMIVSKPVLYCYSQEPISVDLQLGFKSDMFFSYPDYTENGWNFTVDQNGIEVNSLPYPYLFWEGKTDHLEYNLLNNTVEGYVVKTDTIISFFETTLTAFGLNQVEKTDFISFWGPKIVQSPYALIQFKTDEVYAEEIASINVNPAPDKMLRMFMLFSPLDQEKIGSILVETPEIPHFERSGFTLIEWGGGQTPIEGLLLNALN